MLEIISLAISIFALVISLPSISKFFTYFLYAPRIEVFIPPIGKSSNKSNWSDIVKRSKINASDLTKATLNIRSLCDEDLCIYVEFILDRPWKLKPNLKKYFVKSGVRGGYPREGRFWFRSEEFYLPGNSVLGISFPFMPKQERCKLEVVIYPKIHLSELCLPRFFGFAELRPVRKVFEITP